MLLYPCQLKNNGEKMSFEYPKTYDSLHSKVIQVISPGSDENAHHYFKDSEFMSNFYDELHKNDSHQIKRIILLTRFIRSVQKSEHKEFTRNIQKVYSNIFSRVKKLHINDIANRDRRYFYYNLHVVSTHKKEIEKFIVQELYFQSKSKNVSKENTQELLTIFIQKNANLKTVIDTLIDAVKTDIKFNNDKEKIDFLLVVLGAIQSNINTCLDKIDASTNGKIADFYKCLHIHNHKMPQSKRDAFIEHLTEITIQSIKGLPYLFDQYESYVSLVFAEKILGVKIRDSMSDANREWLKINIEHAFIIKCKQDIRDIKLKDTLEICYGNKSALTKRIIEIGNQNSFSQDIKTWLLSGAKIGELKSFNALQKENENKFDYIFAELLMALVSMNKVIIKEENDLIKQEMRECLIHVKEIMQVRKIKFRNKQGEIIPYAPKAYDIDTLEDCNKIKVKSSAIVKENASKIEIVLIKGVGEKYE